MNYASNINSLNSSLSKIDSSKNKISNNTINNYWKGNASSKQLEKINKLMDAINTQKDQVNKLISALNLIDEIDSLKATIDSYNDYLSKYDSEPSWYNKNYNDYISVANKRTVAFNVKTKKNMEVRKILNNINYTYSSLYTVINYDVISSTKSIFDEMLNESNSINDGLNLNNVVTDRFRSFDKNSLPDWNNYDAWIGQNPYAGPYTGQCTWFAWGRFYEMYGYSGWDSGDGRDCAGNLIAKHPDKFELSHTPVSGSVVSFQGRTYGHVGIVLDVSDGMVTFQDGNMNGTSDSFEVAQSDYRTETVTMDEFYNIFGYDAVIANPK